MAHSLNYHTILSQAVPVRFAGFYSDTAQLGRAGWNMATDERMDHYRGAVIRVILHHKQAGLSMTGIMHNADDLRLRRSDLASTGRFGMRADEYDAVYYEARRARQPYIEIQHAGSKGHMVMNMMGEPPPYRWRDLHEQVATTSTMTELHRLPLFAELYAPQPETQEIIVEPQTVQSLLDQILQLQAPERREIRARDARRERDPAPRQVHAQIISMAA